MINTPVTENLASDRFRRTLLNGSHARRNQPMITLSLILLIAAFIAFAITAFSWYTPSKVNLLALGLALWVLSLFIDRIQT
jgi:hypothetical protein